MISRGSGSGASYRHKRPAEESTRTGAKRPHTSPQPPEQTDTPPHASAPVPRDLLALWQELPPELLQRIAWTLATPTRMGQRHEGPRQRLLAAQAIGQALLRLALVNTQLRQLLRPLLRMARWSVDLALMWMPGSTPSSVERLLANPATPVHGDDRLHIGTPPELGQRRLDALLDCVAERARTPAAQALLARLFEAWLARLDSDSDAAARLAHLPLHDLPQRLFLFDGSLDPHFVFEHLGYEGCPMHTPGTLPVNLLMQHLLRFEEDLKLFIWLHLEPLLEDEDPELSQQVAARLQALQIDRDPVVERVRRWRADFLAKPVQAIDEALAREVLQALGQMPLLFAAVPLALLAKFCGHERLRALASDETWVALIHRAMAESHGSPAWMRALYLFSVIPPELGVSAFKRLPAAQRLGMLRLRSNHDHMPYVEALVRDGELPLAQRIAALDRIIELVSSHPGSRRLPQLRAWREQLARALG